MSVNIHFLKASGRLEPLEAHIRKTLEEKLPEIKEKIAIPAVDIGVADNPLGAIPETGTGGFAPTAHVLYINIDPESPHIQSEEALGKELCSTLAHELHHCARWAAIGYGDTLLEAMVSEGLADHFDIEMNGGEPKPWSIALRGEELANTKEKAAAFFDTKDYDHSAWFFGAGGHVPKWTGYAVGYDLAARHIQKTGKPASALVGEPAQSFI